jgi:cytochrome c-type biogenesis protein CcmH/NrfF
MAEKILQAIIWILPGLLLLVVLILVISSTDRRSRANRPGEDRNKRTKP